TILIIVNLSIDYYIWWTLRRRYPQRTWSKIQLWSAVAINLFLLIVLSVPHRTGEDSQLRFIMWSLFSYLTIYAAKLIFLICDAISLLPKIWHSKRWKWLTPTGAILGLFCFLTMWYGALINRYSIDVNEVTVEIKDLSKAFDGYRIVQISDFHVGTYGNDTTFVHQVVERINSLHPDAVLFTGDIVNRHAQELQPFIKTLSQVKAPGGVYAILGNHDYGDYYDWDSPIDKDNDRHLLLSSFSDMGWDLILNDHRWLVNSNDSLALIGVENIGDPPFKVYGDLEVAYPDTGDSHAKILLTHNPAHWENDIADHPDQNIALTLSGHTHAMQMQVGSISPASLRYKYWGGLYHDSQGQQLYVNIGLGAVGLPMRIGATPEITVITLRPKK
ncbi:MAG: metallophosphoesterase, partial [Muribaculaceae bacterium]|nr:metallophosphoesterase [Muribaculaceae bacterium]